MGKFLMYPTALDDEDMYLGLTARAKQLYVLLRNRLTLSSINAVTDQHGTPVVYCTIKEACRILGCCHDTATKTYRELEGVKLIKRRKRGQGKADMIYVRDILCDDDDLTDPEEGY